MTDSTKHKHESAAFVLAAVGLALITILTGWKLKQFKYRLITEPGVAMFYGMLLGLTATFLASDQEECKDNAGSLCSLNGTAHVFTVNITAHVRCCRHVEKVNKTCPVVLIPRMNEPLISTEGVGCLHGVLSTVTQNGLPLLLLFSVLYQVASSIQETFDPEVLFNLFLPPIIFHGAYTLNQKRFIGNLGSIATFAFLGTIISCVTIGACVYGFTRLMVLLGREADGDFLLTDCLLFGAIMSATDPVSILGLLSELRVDLDLHTLLFGESVLNDATAIVLTHAITTYSQMGAGHTFDPPTFFLSVGHFLGVLSGSFFLGFVFTVITALLTKFTRLCESPLLETSVFFLLSWSSFLLAEASGLSGVVAVLFCGLSQARYTIHNLSSEGKSRAEQLFEVFNFLGEIFIFSYMGYVLLTFPQHDFKALFISGTFVSIFISRALNIYPLSFLLNLGRTTKIPRSFQHFMMFTGLRGAVAFSLAVRDTSTEVRRTILTTTLLLVSFTIWVLGMTADPMLRCLDIRVGVDADENPEDLPLEVATGSSDTTPGLWSRLDYKYIKPVLTHCGPPLTDSLPQWCGLFARVFSSPHVHKDEEQLCETTPAQDDDTIFDLEKAEDPLVCVAGDSGSEHQEDLLEGDLGLGNVPALREA